MNIGPCRINSVRQTHVRFLMLFLWLIPFPLLAQNYPSSHYTMRDGLPSMAVRCIYKDSRDLLWIGTDAGLCSFDGRSFRIFEPSEGMTAGKVWAIAEDEEGDMWFGSHGDGLYKYNGKEFKKFTKKDGLSDDRIRVLCYSKNFHCLIAGGYAGVSTIRGERITSSPGIMTPKNLHFDCVTGIADAGRFIYITTYNGFNPIRYYPDQNRFISAHDSGPNYPGNSFSVYLTSKKNTLFSLTNKGVRILKKTGEIVQNDTLGQIFGMTEDKRGDLWLASWSMPGMNLKGGIFRYNGKGFHNYKTSFGISDREIWSLYCDREHDILWVGTLNEGLFRIPFTGITTFPPSYFKLQQQKINNLLLDSKNRLWISGSHELIRMNPDGDFSMLDKNLMMRTYRKEWKTYKPKSYANLLSDEHEAQKLNRKGLPDFEKRTDFDFRTVIEDTDHNFLFYTRFGNFYFDEKNKITKYLGVNDGLAELAITGGDTLIFAGWGWTYLHPGYRACLNKKYNYTDFKSPLYINFSKEQNPTDVSRVVSHLNRCWYTTTASGLWMSQGMHLVNFNKADSTISNNLNDLCFDEKEHVIFGSNTGEICIASYAANQLKIDYRISKSNGLQGNSVQWLLADQHGHLWAGTNKGLNRIDLDLLYRTGKYNIRFMDQEEGYTGQSSSKGVMDQVGNIWLGADDQLIRLDTKSFLENDFQSDKITLKSMEINGTQADDTQKNESGLRSSIPSGKVKLKYSENDLVFYFELQNFINPGKEKFRYMLKGYDEIWSRWGNSRKAVYTNLPPGDYAFCAEAVNSGTLAHIKPLEVKFTIRHPWWGHWYVQVMLLALLLAAGIVIIRRGMEIDRNKERRKLETEKKIIQLEMQALQAQMNPHFIFNCVNNIQYYVIANQMDLVLSYLSDFSKVVRESLGNATQRMISLEQEIEFLNSYLRLEKMRFPDKFDYVIHSIRMEEVGKVRLPPMLVQPFAENAIRHGFGPLISKGNLSITFETGGEDMLKCTITDNGIGREKARMITAASPTDEGPHSTGITGTRLRLYNTSESPARFKIVYTDLSENGHVSGLMVELFLPMEMALNFYKEEQYPERNLPA